MFERLRSASRREKDGLPRVETASRHQEIRLHRTRRDFLRLPRASEPAESVFELVEVVFERLGSDSLRVEHRSQRVEHGLLSVEIDPERERSGVSTAGSRKAPTRGAAEAGLHGEAPASRAAQ